MCACISLHHLLISISPGNYSVDPNSTRRKARVESLEAEGEEVVSARETWRLKERKREGNWRWEIKAVTEKVKEFFTRGSGWERGRWRGRGIWQSQESLKMRNREYDSQGGWGQLCLFDGTKANVWVLSILNEYRAFSSCAFLSNAFPFSTASAENGSLPWG